MGKVTVGLASCCLLAGVLSVISLTVQAVTNVNVRVTVVAPSCTVNNNKPIEVDFGSVMTTRVNGTNYRKPVNYTLSCEGGSNAMKLQVQGTAASFDGNVLKTSVPALGIKLQHGSHDISVNHWMNFTSSNKPELWVVPVSQSGMTLPGGEFSATAMMKVSYQ